MSRSRLRAFLKPILAIAFLGFGALSVFGGFQSVTLELQKSSTGAVDGTLTRSHFFGLYTVSVDLRAVREAVIETGTVHARPGVVFHVSRVALVSDSDKTRIFAGGSNLDEAYKHEVASTVNAYIGSRDRRSFHETFTISNFFGWLGVVLVLVGIYGALTWPISTIRSRRAAREHPYTLTHP